MAAMTTGKYIGYVRVSTRGQADSGLSLEAQENKIRMYAELFEFEVSHIEMDAGLSGTSLDRPGLQRALASIESGESAGLIIAKLDRLSRSVSHTAQLIARYFASGEHHLLSVTDNLNTTTANGRMVINILSTMAQWEAEVISERTRAALQVLRDDSVPLGPLPYGMSRGNVGSNGRRVVVTDEVEVGVRDHIVALRNGGRSLRYICGELESMGIKTKKGRAKWQASTVKQIIDRVAEAA